MTPNEYASAIVIPTLREFLAERGSQRRAFLACVAVYHTIDHLAQAKLEEGLSRTANQKRRHEQANLIRTELRKICAPALAVIDDMCNGTKHGRPVAARDVPVFAWDVPGAGWGQGRWDVPGLQVKHDTVDLFIDGCAQAVMLTLRALYGPFLDPIDLSFFDVQFRGHPGWQEPVTAPV